MERDEVEGSEDCDGVRQSEYHGLCLPYETRAV